jgi:hypothetical protein
MEPRIPSSQIEENSNVKIKSAQDFWAGILFACIGCTAMAIVLVQKYTIGSASAMGPGYFPIMLSAGIVAVGLALLACGVTVDGVPVSRTAWRPVISIVAAVVVFGQLIESVGIVLTIAATVVIASLGYGRPKWREVALVAGFLALLAVAVFKYALGQPLSVWGAFWTS